MPMHDMRLGPFRTHVIDYVAIVIKETTGRIGNTEKEVDRQTDTETDTETDTQRRETATNIIGTDRNTQDRDGQTGRRANRL